MPSPLDDLVKTKVLHPILRHIIKYVAPYFIFLTLLLVFQTFVLGYIVMTLRKATTPCDTSCLARVACGGLRT
jgi:hypothetical protein